MGIIYGKKQETAKNKTETNTSSINKNEIAYQENVSIPQLKEETGMQADEDLYEIQVEYDGKQVLDIKPDIQYKTAFAGMIKQSKPEFSEIDTLYETEHPTQSGIWIEPHSRDRFLEMLKDNMNCQYQILDDGYLQIKANQNPKQEDIQLQKMIKSDSSLYIIAVSGVYYEVDRVTGEIIDQPFEMMDPYQASKMVETGNGMIIFLSENVRQKLTTMEVLEEVITFGK